MVKAKDVHLARNKHKLLFMLPHLEDHWKDVKPQIIKISSSPLQNATKIQFASFCGMGISAPTSCLQDFLFIRKKESA